MEPLFFFKNMSSSDAAALRDYFVKKTPRLDKLLSHFPGDAALLQVKGERFSKHSAFEVELILKLPNQTFLSREASHLITKAVDLALDRLTMQIKKSAMNMRRSHRSVKTRGKLKMREAYRL